tara:strand:+ start:3971 stop:4948 length:978 start_codon:yes stop_codon:yes gene_type:complete
MTTEEPDVHIVILAFNAGTSGLVVNGPGISLRNLIIFMNRFYPNVSFSLFTRFRANILSPNLKCFSVKNKQQVNRSIKSCDVVHLWSGLRKSFFELASKANLLGKPVIVGPNLIDTVDLATERSFFKKVKFKKLLAPNPLIGESICLKHNVNPSMVTDFMVGPDANLWKPPSNYADYILWKGNSKQPVKGLTLAKEVANNLSEYKFLFMGEESRYSYEDHIYDASRAMLYINTSISETKGMAQLEQMAAGVPSVVSNGVYSKGIDGHTGFFSERSVDSFCSLIKKVLSDPKKLSLMRDASREYVRKNFCEESISRKYMEIISNVS